jgi:SAM-dependent methyltransferase
MEFCRQITAHGRSPIGANFLEVGTGWRLNLPIACWLCGARRIWTIDLNHYLQFDLIKEDLQFLHHNREHLLTALWGTYGELLDLGRWHRLVECPPANFAELSDLCGIIYQAPIDAGRTPFDANSFDFHVSCNVFEHIPPHELRSILVEANRITKPDGLLIHRVDHTDHFSHYDSRLSQIHFLQYSDGEWRRYAGNRYAYVNRLREDDYFHLFNQCGQEVREVRSQIDGDVKLLLQDGFPLDTRFCAKTNDNLSRLTSVFIVSPAPASKATAAPSADPAGLFDSRQVSRTRSRP